VRVRYHVIVVMPSSSAILVDRQESMWLLPCMADENTVRGADVVRRGLAAIGVSGRIRWMEAIAFQRAAAELQMLAVVDAAGPCTAPEFTAVAPEEIKPGSAVLPVQATALTVYRRAVGDDTSDHGPSYRNARMWWALDTWLADTLDAAGLRRTGVDRQYKALASDTVLTLATTGGPIHFKGCARSPFVEAELGQYLAERWPSHVAPTLAYDRRHGWWLTHHAPGYGLTHNMTLRKGLAVVETLALMQADACAHVDELAGLGCPRLDLDRVVRNALTLLADASTHASLHDNPPDHLTHDMRDALARADRVAAALTEAAARLHALQPPITWLHTDLADSNIFVDAGADGRARVTFIDLASPFIGPASIALYSFLHYLPRYVDRDRLIGEGWTTALKARYAHVWAARGWRQTEDSFRSAKLIAYAMKTLKGLESPLTRGVSDANGADALRQYVGVRSAARLCQAVLSARDASDQRTPRRESDSDPDPDLSAFSRSRSFAQRVY